jgi:hypothetical protein
MAIVSATLQHEHDIASLMADELQAAEARFGLIVAAEFLSEAVRTIAGLDQTSTLEVWQEFCLRVDHAIDRAGTARTRPQSDRSADPNVINRNGELS